MSLIENVTSGTPSVGQPVGQHPQGRPDGFAADVGPISVEHMALVKGGLFGHGGAEMHQPDRFFGRTATGTRNPGNLDGQHGLGFRKCPNRHRLGDIL